MIGIQHLASHQAVTTIGYLKTRSKQVAIYQHYQPIMC